MASTRRAIVESKYAENSQTTQYTATNCRTTIEKITGTNVSASNATISIHLVPSGGAADATNKNVVTKALQPNEDYSFTTLAGHTLNSGDFISTIASAASAIVIRVTGTEQT